jgi:hypothetical protein
MQLHISSHYGTLLSRTATVEPPLSHANILSTPDKARHPICFTPLEDEMFEDHF